MNSMKLLKKYELKICGKWVGEVTIKDEWNDMLELDGGDHRGKLIVRRKNWINSKAWAHRDNAFIEQELDLIYADRRFGLPETEVIFVKPETKQDA